MGGPAAESLPQTTATDLRPGGTRPYKEGRPEPLVPCWRLLPQAWPSLAMQPEPTSRLSTQRTLTTDLPWAG